MTVEAHHGYVKRRVDAVSWEEDVVTTWCRLERHAGWAEWVPVKTTKTERRG